jgi:hypothetical protein
VPRFYFDTRNDGRTVRDDSGLELAGLDAVQDLAIRSLTEIAADELPRSDRRTYGIDVRDEGGEAVLTTELTLETRRHA